MAQMLFRRFLVILAALVLIGAGAALAADQPRKGGVLKIGNLGEPPSLDPHWGTQTITEILSNHLYEGLYSLDAGYRPIPMLADGMPQVSADGLTYTIKLRQGIKFHNGKEMTSDDVVASIRRWSQRAVYGKSLFAQVVDFRAVDKYTVQFKLKEKSAIVVISLAVPNGFGAIYPKEVADKFPPDQRITEFIGTGPFKLVEWKPDQYIRRYLTTKPGASRALATAVPRSRTWTSCAGSRCRTRRAAPPRSSQATSTSPTTSSPTPMTGSRRTSMSSPSSYGHTTGSSRSSTRRKA
jgi:ABC-type transport system substrate-binding protein